MYIEENHYEETLEPNFSFYEKTLKRNIRLTAWFTGLASPFIANKDYTILYYTILDYREDTVEDNGANNDINDVEIKQEIDYNDDMSCAHEGDNDKDNLIDTFHASSNDTEEYETDGGHDIDLENEAKANVHDDRSSGAEDDEQWNMVCVPKMLPMKRQFVFKGPKALIINRHLLKTKETTSENTDDDNKTGGRKSKKKKKEKKRKGCSGCKPCEIGEKRVHECTVCHKILRYCSEFKYHMNRHTREKKFTCAICKKSYHDQFYLHQHKRMHSEGNLVFLLPLCIMLLLSTASILEFPSKEIQGKSKGNLQ